MPLKTRRLNRNAKPTLSRSARGGAIIVLFAVLLPVLVLVLGFTIDYAYIQRSRNEVRVIADLAAKTAADTLARSGGDENAALAAARFVADNNTVAGENITLEDDQVVFGRSSQQPDESYQFTPGQRPANSVQVIAKRDDSTAEGPVASFFGALYNRPTFDVAQVAEAAFRDVEIALVLDRSGSMKQQLFDTGLTQDQKSARRCSPPPSDSRWASLDAAVEVFLVELESTPVQEKVAMVTFAERPDLGCDGEPTTIEQVTLDSPLSANLANVRTEMNRLKNTVWYGGTNITAGLKLAHEHFNSFGSPAVDKLIICLTDGVHNSGDEPFDEATECANGGITVHTITFSDGANKEDMILTAKNGGGSHSHASDEETLKTIFKRLAGSAAFISK